jgi:hypothetical protein
MLIAAGIIYVIFAVLTGPFWPLELLGGKAGPLGYLLVIVWLGLLIGGSVS